jgi:hypothetical protein
MTLVTPAQRSGLATPHGRRTAPTSEHVFNLSPTASSFSPKLRISMHLRVRR